MQKCLLGLTVTLAATCGILTALILGPDIGQQAILEATFGSLYAPGQRFADVEFARKDTDLAVVVIGRGTCGGCQLALPHLNTLINDLQSRSRNGVASAFVVPTIANVEDRAFARQAGLEQVAPISMPRLRTTVIPTVLVIGRDGRILYVHRGLFLDAERRKILEMLNAG